MSNEERPEPEHRSLSSELKGTEALLAALRPAAPAIDRDRVMYEAGLAAGRVSAASRGVVIRRATTLAALAASLLLGMYLGERRGREAAPHIDVATTSPAESPVVVESASLPALEMPAKLPADSYGELRKHLAAADAELPRAAVDRHDVVPDSGSWRSRSSDLLRALN